MVELVDTLDLGSSAARCESSSLSVRTKLVARPLAEKGAAPEKGCAFFVLAFLNVQAPLIVLKRRVVESGISAFPL